MNERLIGRLYTGLDKELGMVSCLLWLIVLEGMGDEMLCLELGGKGKIMGVWDVDGRYGIGIGSCCINMM